MPTRRDHGFLTLVAALILLRLPGWSPAPRLAAQLGVRVLSSKAQRDVRDSIIQMSSIEPQTFITKVHKEGSFVFIPLPFLPREVWGLRPRYHVSGTVNGCTIRGCLGAQGSEYFLRLGAAWIRDNGIGSGTEVTVCLAPEGPQASELSLDLTRALSNNKAAKAFFDGLPTFYRKNYIRWIEAAKRPDTRAKRISEMVALLAAGKREK